MAEVKIVRLLSGETLIGQFDEEKYTITDCALIILDRDEKGNICVELVPYIPFTDDKEIKIERYSVVTVVNPKEGLVQHYNQQFNHIMIAPAGMDKQLSQNPNLKVFTGE